jgi:hypothetical protein
MKTLLLPILFLLTTFGLFDLYIDPTYMSIGELLKQKSEYISAIVKAGELNAKKDELLTKFNNIPKEKMDELSALIPDKFNGPKFIADLDSIAGRHGISIKNVVITEQQSEDTNAVADPSIPVKKYYTNKIGFKFSSTYDNLGLFLKDLEKSLQLIDVKSIRFQFAETKDSKPNGLHDYDLSFQTYWLK